MCGLVGFLSEGAQFGNTGAEKSLQHMADRILHRGPDSAGYWCNRNECIALGHRRLAIVDLSPAGQQPMHSASGRYVMAFNGEIYNHLDLRKLLADAAAPDAKFGEHQRTVWRGHSDTETLLAAFDIWGIEVAIKRVVGMFAFAVWDRQERVLTLGRDRLGEKPLYYGWQGKGDRAAFLFASELKALRGHPAFSGDIDRDALCLYMRHNAIAAPYSIYKGISKLPPGCLLTVSPSQREPKIWSYWSVAQIAESAVANTFDGAPNDAVDAMESVLKHAVRQQMVADVPLGAFLSGGVDSSTIVALMQSQSTRPVKTFSIGFHEAGFNEAEYAKSVARHLGTDHTEMYVTPAQALAVIPNLPAIYDEPFSDSSQIPTFLVSQLARQHVTVALSGDAGDELFCGYQRYMFASNLWRRIAALPLPLRTAISRGITALSPQSWNRLANPFTPWLKRGKRPLNIGDKLHKGARILPNSSSDALYRQLVSHWDNPGLVVRGGHEPSTYLFGNSPSMEGLDDVQRMMVLDMLSYLPDDILTKVDRAAMSVSLESRIPFLDHRVVEFAWSLPQSLKVREGHNKWILRQVLYRHVPKALIERPKMGFGVPIDSWLRGPLREWAEDLLDESRLRQDGFFNPVPIRQKWQEHLAGQRNWQYHLWDVLMFQAWAACNV